MKYKLLKTTTISLLIASFLAGCATNQHQGTAMGGAQDPCNFGNAVVQSAVAGAIFGGFSGGKDGAVKGAIAGGLLGAGACALVNANSRQIKSAHQANVELQRSRVGAQLPAEPTVMNYVAKLDSQNVRRGQLMKITSTINLADGSRFAVQDVKEEVLIYMPDGSELLSKTKPLQMKGAGGYENTFSITLPEGLSQGVYSFKTSLYVNGKQTASRNLRAQVAWLDGEVQLVAVL